MISREIEPNIKIFEKNPIDLKEEKNFVKKPSIWQEFTLQISKVNNLKLVLKTICFIQNHNIQKERDESLGINIEGGLASFKNENTPIFVTSIDSKSCIEKIKHIKVSEF